MDVPSWVTLPDLGTYDQAFSFDLNPIVISFSAGGIPLVTKINGELPAGLSWSVSGQSVVIAGVAEPAVSTITSRFTFRITQNNGSIADRTFSISLTPQTIAPSWTGQASFLGYQSNSTTRTYQLRASVPQDDYVTYGLLSSVPGLSINPASGLLTYFPDGAPAPSSVVFDVRAYSSSTANSDVTLSIGVPSEPSVPLWITPAGAVDSPDGGIAFPGSEFIEVNLVAEDISGSTVTYDLDSSDPGFPLTLSSTGSLFGLPPNPLVNTTYGFVANATSDYGSNVRSFSVTIAPSETYNQISWVSNSDLGSFSEGQYVEIPLLARTVRPTTVVYNVTGGFLPPSLMLQSTAGYISGYLDYHAIPRSYTFDVTANDGYQSITRQFTISVSKRYYDYFFGAYIPLTGPLREAWAADASNVRVRQPGTVIVEGVTNIVNPPIMSIINGIASDTKTADELVRQSSPWFHQLQMRIGQAGATNTAPLTASLFRQIVDEQSGSNTNVYSSAVYNTNVQTGGMVYPISIQNLRQALVGDSGFVDSGSGSGTILFPVLDWSIGSLQDVIIVEAGSGYNSAPAVSVSGSGLGARVQTRIGIIGVEIYEQGTGWIVGDDISIGGVADERGVLRVTEVGPNGELIALEISNPGEYAQVPASPITTVFNDQATAYVRISWGVVSATVLEPGAGYRCAISLGLAGGEILPPWQSTYFPAIEVGSIGRLTTQAAISVLNTGDYSIYGSTWLPRFVVFQWQGLRWLGSTSLDADQTTFDGDTTRFEETDDASTMIFDEDLTRFDQDRTTFDSDDPLAYDLFRVWGSTIIDDGMTVFDLYSTIFDALGPSRRSRTLVSRWIGMTNRIYSGNNAVI